MINIIIDALILKSDKMSFKEMVLFFALAFIIATPLAFLFIFLTNVNQVYWGAISAITALAIPIVIFLLERHRIKRAKDNFDVYNYKLDQLRDVLKELTYKSNGVDSNWYSKEKIQYLINECNKTIDECSSPKRKSMDFLKLTVLPIISFVAGVIADKASMETSLSLAGVAVTFAFTIWGVKQIVEFLDDLILKSSSIGTIKSVRDKLKDLLVRDFEYVGEL